MYIEIEYKMNCLQNMQDVMKQAKGALQKLIKT